MSALFAVLFAWAAVLQWNDPDPLVWAAVYGAGAVASALGAAGRLAWPFAATVSAIALVWAGVLATRTVGVVDFARLFDSFEMKGDLRIEEAREMVGLLIVGGWNAVLAWVARREAGNRAR